MIIVFATILVFIFGSAEGIINGELTTWKQHGYMASIVSRNNKFICSAIVWTTSTLICNADCVANKFPKDYQIRYRSSYFNKEGKLFDIRQFVTYYDYKPNHFMNNFALVHTAEFITYSDPKPKISTVKLPEIMEPIPDWPGPKPEMTYYPEIPEEAEELNDEMKFYTVGWGIWKQGKPGLSEQLRQSRLVKISNEECSKSLNITISGPEVFCVKSLDNNQKLTYGDEGAPILGKNNFLYGIASFGTLTSDDVAKPTIVINLRNYFFWLTDFRV